MTGNEPQETIERVQMAGEVRCLLPAFLCTHIFIKRETSGYKAGSNTYFFLFFKDVSRPPQFSEDFLWIDSYEQPPPVGDH